MERRFSLRNTIVHILAFTWLAVFVLRYTDLAGTWRGVLFFLCCAFLIGWVFPIITYKKEREKTHEPIDSNPPR